MKKIILGISGCLFVLIFSVCIYFEAAHSDTIKLKQEEREAKLIAQKLKEEDELSSKKKKPKTFGEYFYAMSEKTSFNNELQAYISGQSKIKKNTIALTADKINDNYLSGKVVSKEPVRYGRFSFKINTTLSAKGMFPAIWMLPENGDRYPEIDIYEMIGSEPSNLYCTMHYEKNQNIYDENFKYRLDSSRREGSYVLTFVWTEDRLDWFIDNSLIGSITENVPSIPMNLIINLAVGGDWPGDPDDSAFPQTFEVEILEYSPGE